MDSRENSPIYAIPKTLSQSIPNRFLQSVLHYINEQMLRYNYARFYAFKKKAGGLEKSMADHKEILKALKNKDKKKVKSLMAKHWGSLLKPSPFKDGLKEYLNNE